ncbi:MAG: SGNH/GDSL hydrolase family protein [Fermentimonas sp.]|nr:SGNH/GDSL hydrolase family protein [Fermentimonas sp.]
MKNSFIVFLLLLLVTTYSQGQTKWYNPMESEFPVIQNRGWNNEIKGSYQRLPDRAEKIVRKSVWDLSENSAGLAIHFITNAEKIEVRYGVAGAFAMDHMPATGKSGVDLYAIDSEGNWKFITDRYNFSDTITFSYTGVLEDKGFNNGYEYRLYLPLYNSVKWMEIGVPDSAEFAFIPLLNERPIVVYGTSIAQGGCASRPAMGWTNILSRKLDYPVVNLAFSGNGPLEKEMVDLISELDGSLIIYDCLPNMLNLTVDEVKKRTAYGISAIREKSDIPILITDHIGYMNDGMIKGRKEMADRLNSASREVFDSLKNAGVSNIYYLHKDSINFPADGTVDYIHPNDLGMQVYSEAYEKVVRQILSMLKGDIKTTQPVSQRREPYIYEWKERHRQKLELIKKDPPKKVIIGNSIIHYWNDEKGRENGPESWEKYVEPEGFLNLGYGWDRIENVLWRVYHGELDGYKAEEVVLMIGINNIGISSDEEIVEGLNFLLRQIEIRQKDAVIKVVGLLPMRSQEDRVKRLNEQISVMVHTSGCYFINPGVNLLKDDKIDESLFNDGLHPNEKGYSLIAPIIASAVESSDISNNKIPEVKSENTTRLMTYNIRNARGLDDVTDYQRIANVIKKNNPDIIAIQELDSVTTRSNGVDVLDVLAGKTNLHPTYAAAIDYDGGKYGIGILSKEKPLSIKRVPLPGREESRMLLIVEMNDYYFACTHFSLNSEDRMLSVDVINSEATKLNPDKPFFLSGDINATPESDVLKEFYKSFTSLVSPDEFTIPADTPDKCIDYIFGHSSRGDWKSIGNRGVIDESVASDHRPLYADVRISSYP